MISKQITLGRNQILFDAQLGVEPKLHWFMPIYWAQLDVVQAELGGRGAALLVDPELSLKDAYRGERWVLRHYQRGGWVARLSDDAYIYTGAERTRPFREWRLLAELHAEGFPVPRPIAARFSRIGPVYRGDLITAEVPDALTLTESLAEQRPVDWADIGRTLRSFHRRGVFHADLNAHNLLLDGSGGVHVIDLDKGAIRSTAQSWPSENLARLRRSLDKVAAEDRRIRFEASDWSALKDAYDSA